VDDSEGFDPGSEVSEPITERARIYGAQPAATIAGTGSVGTDPGRYSPGEPSGSVPVLPHWTDPPTGQVPAIVDSRANDPDADPLATPGGGPSWREHDHEWEEGGFDASLLADDETRLGALDDQPLAERRPWEFGDLSGSGDAGESARWSGTAAGSEWDDAVSGVGARESESATAYGGSAGSGGFGASGESSGDNWWEDESEPSDYWDDDRDAEDTSFQRESGPSKRHPSDVGVSVMALGEGLGRPGATDGTDATAGTDGDRAVGGTTSGATFVAAISSSPLRRTSSEIGTGHGRPARRRTRRTQDGFGTGHSPGGQGAGRSGGRSSGRNMPVAIATGVGIVAVALVCFAAGPVVTLVLSTVVVTLAAAEAYAALRRAGRKPATLLGLVATVAVMVSVYAKGVAALPLVLVLLVLTSMVWYLVGAERTSAVEGITTTLLGFAWVGMLGSFAALMLAPSQYPQRHGVAFLLGAVVATVAGDVGALAVGRWIGRHLMAPKISPRKTWEGWIGGAVFSIVASVLITGHVHPWTPGKAAVLGVVAAIVGPIGDLCESLIKRDLGLKDMGSLLPGHGGVLDRIDALLFVLPATYYLVRVLHLG
jgi:CDP-diglyceride synthetase